MKTKLFYAAAFVCSLFFAACSGGGPSDATKKSVAAFDSAWGQMSMNVMALSDSVKSALAKCEACCKGSESCCEHLKGKMDSVMAPCKNDMTAFQGIMETMNGAKPQWDSAAASFTAFKEKVNKGEIKDEEATKTLAEFQSKMDEGGKIVADWWNKFNEAKASCEKNMQSCMQACTDMKCTDKKCADMHKKHEKKS
jgi:polyhydroxyalkanoate synthesis regulator phasin